MSKKERKVTVIKSNGTREPFNVGKLEASLKRSGAESVDIQKVVHYIESRLHQNITTREIYQDAYKKLRSLQRSAALHYSLRDAVIELGPTGYPFEDLVARVMERRGFDVKTRVMMKGRCIEHEVDIYAHNKSTGEVFIIETKFHNEHGTRSDLQTALYTKARFDDIVAYPHNDDLTPPKSVWLVTNTKFTHSAIQYSECAGVRIIGWNYPGKGNLQQLIEESDVHPITALTTLSSSQKKKLIKNGVVMCRDINDAKDQLQGVGVSKEKIAQVLDEASFICKT